LYVLRIVHLVPDHPEAQVQTPGLEHVAPFAHAGVQTAEEHPFNFFEFKTK